MVVFGFRQEERLICFTTLPTTLYRRHSLVCCFCFFVFLARHTPADRQATAIAAVASAVKAIASFTTCHFFERARSERVLETKREIGHSGEPKSRRAVNAPIVQIVR